MADKYVVTYLDDDNDLYSQVFDSGQAKAEALAFIHGGNDSSMEDVGEYGPNGKNVGLNKSLLIRIEDTDVTVEDFT